MQPKQFLEDVEFMGRVRFRVLPESASSQLTPLSTTPSVGNGKLFRGGAAVVSITNFLGGQDSQDIYIIGDGTTTLVQGTYIKTNTGANKLLAANRLYHLIYDGTTMIWYEE